MIVSLRFKALQLLYPFPCPQSRVSQYTQELSNLSVLSVTVTFNHLIINTIYSSFSKSFEACGI